MSERRHVWQWLLIGACCVLVARSSDWRTPGGVTDRAIAAEPIDVTGPGSTIAATQTRAGHPTLPGRDESTRPVSPGLTPETVMQLASAPLHFERNDGQAPSGVTFLARGAGYAVLLSDTETAILLSTAPVVTRRPRTPVALSFGPDS